MTTGEETYRGLRALALQTSPTDLKLNLDNDQIVAYGTLMEMGYPRAAVTLVAFISGDASIYFGNGGGLIGSGAAHESVRAAAANFVRNAQEYLSQMEKSSDFPLPRTDYTRFYILTNHGVYRSAEYLENDLGNGRSDYSALFHSGQNVISAIRINQEHTN